MTQLAMNFHASDTETLVLTVYLDRELSYFNECYQSLIAFGSQAQYTICNIRSEGFTITQWNNDNSYDLLNTNGNSLPTDHPLYIDLYNRIHGSGQKVVDLDNSSHRADYMITELGKRFFGFRHYIAQFRPLEGDKLIPYNLSEKIATYNSNRGKILSEIRKLQMLSTGRFDGYLSS